MSARLKLTLSYAAFLAVAGVALAALLFYLLRFVPDSSVELAAGFAPSRGDLLRALWPRLLQVGAVLLVVGFVGGWFLAGRMLKPLRRIHDVAVRVDAGSLDDRVRLGGARDEFRELADTLDGMLDRLQAAFEEQKRFAANASHELRTPYAISRSLIEVALADLSGTDVERLLRRLDDTNRRGAEAVEALLALAALEHAGALDPEPVDVAELTGEVVGELRPVAESGGVTVWTSLGEGDVDGREALVRQLVANLVLNGIRHNLPVDGRVDVGTRTAADGAVELRVVNSGPVVSPELVPTLTEPFVRGAGRVAQTASVAPVDATAPPPHLVPEGSGLGLTLVARIAAVHGARLAITAPPTGGLDVRVLFPAPSGAAAATDPTETAGPGAVRGNGRDAVHGDGSGAPDRGGAR
ncbi:sensor histidine kinase [Schumannella soli]|uniref:sensor histidine kinase n=1 Tax=Schumannella soli TaxID=2590779 RepID=UPI0015E832ED|nr:HAMP domain-containing sensor histidine kinase [Schumannella soli]